MSWWVSCAWMLTWCDCMQKPLCGNDSAYIVVIWFQFFANNSSNGEKNQILSTLNPRRPKWRRKICFFFRSYRQIGLTRIMFLLTGFWIHCDRPRDEYCFCNCTCFWIIGSLTSRHNFCVLIVNLQRVIIVSSKEQQDPYLSLQLHNHHLVVCKNTSLWFLNMHI